MIISPNCKIRSGSSGDIAHFVEYQIKKSFELLQDSNMPDLINRFTFSQVNEVYKECSAKGWDGYDAQPILRSTIQNAIIFLETLPLGIEPPTIGADTDGSITLEWYRASERVISISIDSEGWMYFAAIIGTKKRHGVDYALSGVSDDILKIISQIYKDNSW